MMREGTTLPQHSQAPLAPRPASCHLHPPHQATTLIIVVLLITLLTLPAICTIYICSLDSSCSPPPPPPLLNRVVRWHGRWHSHPLAAHRQLPPASCLCSLSTCTITASSIPSTTTLSSPRALSHPATSCCSKPPISVTYPIPHILNICTL